MGLSALEKSFTQPSGVTGVVPLKLALGFSDIEEVPLLYTRVFWFFGGFFNSLPHITQRRYSLMHLFIHFEFSVVEKQFPRQRLLKFEFSLE